jgi:hypothetical protein
MNHQIDFYGSSIDHFIIYETYGYIRLCYYEEFSFAPNMCNASKYVYIYIKEFMRWIMIVMKSLLHSIRI